MDSNGFFGAEDVEFSGNGRYLLDVDGQGQKSYTRATTIAKTLESTFHLDQWKQKNAAKGVASRPDLVARAIVTPVSDKPAWKEILSQAEVVAAGGAKANLGTAFHALHDTVATMTNEEYAAVPADLRDLYEKYRAELARLGIVEVISEVTVCATQIGTAGKADGFVRMPDGSVRVLDRKSGRVTDYPHAPACQLAIYANADKILMDRGWVDMDTQFPTLDRETGLIVDVTYATETTPSSVHIYEIDLMAGWYGALLACKVRRWRNRKDLLTPYQPEQMPMPTTERKVQFTIASRQQVTDTTDRAAQDPEISGAGVPFPVVEPSSPTADLMPVAAAGVRAPSGHPAWSSAQQKIIQVNPDGTAAAPDSGSPAARAAITGFTAAQIEAGEHKNAAEKAAAMAEAALQAAADRQEAAAAEQPATGLAQGYAADQDVLLKAYKTKAAIQAAARRLDPSMNVSRTRANLASDMTSHPQWAARRGEFITEQAPDATPAWKPAPEQVAEAMEATLKPINAAVADVSPAALASVTGQQYPNAGLPDTSSTMVMPPAQANPFAQPAPPADPPSAPKSPEDLAIEAISQATAQQHIAAIWDRCQIDRIPWTPRLQQAAQAKMSSFTK